MYIILFTAVSVSEFSGVFEWLGSGRLRDGHIYKARYASSELLFRYVVLCLPFITREVQKQQSYKAQRLVVFVIEMLLLAQGQ